VPLGSQSVTAPTAQHTELLPTTVRIECNDGVIVLAPYAVLAKHSRLVRDLPDLARQYDDKSDSTLLPLPSTSSRALRLLIGILEARDEVSSAWAGYDIGDLQVVVDAMTTADAYDIPGFHSILLISAVRNLSNQSGLLLWAIAVIVGVEPAIVYSEFLSKTLAPKPEQIPPATRGYLQRHYPYLLFMLDKYQEGWMKLVDELRQQLSSPSPPHFLPDDHCSACRAGSGPRKPCSRAEQWTILQARARRVVLEKFAKPGVSLCDSDVGNVIRQNVTTCRTCAADLLAFIRPALMDFAMKGTAYGIGGWQNTTLCPVTWPWICDNDDDRSDNGDDHPDCGYVGDHR
jgi:hypothetical protein